MFPYGQTFFHFATITQSSFKSRSWSSFKNASTSLMILDILDELTIPYSTIPVFVNRISSQNGAITIADDSGNDLGEKLVNDVPRLRRPLELIYIKVNTKLKP